MKLAWERLERLLVMLPQPHSFTKAKNPSPRLGRGLAGVNQSVFRGLYAVMG